MPRARAWSRAAARRPASRRRPRAQPGCSFEEQFSTLNRHFEHADVKTKSLMLTAYAKLANLYPALRPHVTREMKKLQRHAELEAMALLIQKHVRGWLDRRRVRKLADLQNQRLHARQPAQGRRRPGHRRHRKRR